MSLSWSVFKLTVLLLSAAGCLYQSYRISSMYLEYATVTKVTFTYPDAVAVPSVVACIKFVNRDDRIPEGFNDTNILFDKFIVKNAIESFTSDWIPGKHHGDHAEEITQPDQIGRFILQKQFFKWDYKCLLLQSNLPLITQVQVASSSNRMIYKIRHRFLAKHPEDPWSGGIFGMQYYLMPAGSIHFSGDSVFFSYPFMTHVRNNKTGQIEKQIYQTEPCFTFYHTISHLLPEPYDTACYDYAKAGLESKTGCYEICQKSEALSRFGILFFESAIFNRSNVERISLKTVQTDKRSIQTYLRIAPFCRRRCQRNDCRRESMTGIMMCNRFSKDQTNCSLEIYPSSSPTVTTVSSASIDFFSFLLLILNCVSFWTTFSPLGTLTDDSLLSFAKKILKRHQQDNKNAFTRTAAGRVQRNNFLMHDRSTARQGGKWVSPAKLYVASVIIFSGGFCFYQVLLLGIDYFSYPTSTKIYFQKSEQQHHLPAVTTCTTVQHVTIPRGGTILSVERSSEQVVRSISGTSVEQFKISAFARGSMSCITIAPMQRVDVHKQQGRSDLYQVAFASNISALNPNTTRSIFVHDKDVKVSKIIADSFIQDRVNTAYNKEDVIVFNTFEVQLMPPPYDTNCKDDKDANTDQPDCNATQYAAIKTNSMKRLASGREVTYNISLRATNNFDTVIISSAALNLSDFVINVCGCIAFWLGFSPYTFLLIRRIKEKVPRVKIAKISFRKNYPKLVAAGCAIGYVYQVYDLSGSYFRYQTGNKLIISQPEIISAPVFDFCRIPEKASEFKHRAANELMYKYWSRNSLLDEGFNASAADAVFRFAAYTVNGLLCHSVDVLDDHFVFSLFTKVAYHTTSYTWFTILLNAKVKFYGNMFTFLHRSKDKTSYELTGRLLRTETENKSSPYMHAQFTYREFLFQKLPAPYDTDCTEYRPGNSYASCYQSCYVQKFRSIYKAHPADAQLMIQPNMTLPKIIQVNGAEASSMKQECRSSCKPDCDQDDHVISLTGASLADQKYPFVAIVLRGPNQKRVKVTHFKQMDIVDYISSIFTLAAFWFAFCPATFLLSQHNVSKSIAVHRLQRGICRNRGHKSIHAPD